MSRKYKITNQQGIYFVTFTIVGWVDIFIRNEYKYIFIDSIKYCQIHKGLEVYAWCIMTSHVHLIIGKNGANKIEDIIRDLKSFTSRNIKNAILNNYQESRRQWMMWIFTKAGENNSRNNEFQFWIHNGS